MNKLCTIGLILLTVLGCSSSGGSDLPIIDVTDDLGRRVRLQTIPQRILSLAPSNTELVFALGAGKRLVGRTSHCDAPPEAKMVLSVGRLDPPDHERLLSTKPDLVLMINGHQKLREAFESRDIPVFVMQPRSIEGVFDSIRRLGLLLKTKEKAASLVEKMRGQLDALQERLPRRRPTVFYEVWSDPLITAGPRTFLADLIRAAGGYPMDVNSESDWPKLPLEVLIKTNPSIIITPHRTTIEAVATGKRAGWKSLRAVKTGRLYPVDGDRLARPGPRMIDGVVEIAKLIHPQAFPP